MNNETHRFFLVKDYEVYEQINELLDESRGFPNQLTRRSLTEWENLPKNPAGYALIPVDRWRFEPRDEIAIAHALQAGAVEEIDLETFMEEMRPAEGEEEQDAAPTMTASD